MSREFNIGENGVVQDDRAARQSLDDFLSGRDGSDSVLAVPERVLPPSTDNGAAGDGRSAPARTRNLRATFRTVPGDALPAHSPDPGARGGPVQSAPGRPDSIAAPAPGADDFAGRGTAVLAAGRGAAVNGPAKPADQGGGRGRVRGRVRGGAGSGKKEKPAKTRAVTGSDLDRKTADLVVASAAPRVLIPTESERADARRLFREIGDRFNDNRKVSKTRAYAAYRHDLMANLDTLIMGGAIDLKEVTTVITNLELLTKETEAEATETPATVLGRWLRMGPEELAGLEVAAAVEELTEVEEPDGEAEDLEDGEDQDGQQSM